MFGFVKKRKPDYSRSACRGFTIIEVVVSVVALTLSVSVLFGFLAAADRMSAKSALMQAAAMCALNESERLKAHTADDTRITDGLTEYIQGGRRFVVERRVVHAGADHPITLFPGAVEVEFVVRTFSSDSVLGVFRCMHSGLAR